LKALAWYFLSLDMFRSRPWTLARVPVQQIELKTERVAMAYRLLSAYAFVRPESEQNSSHLLRAFALPWAIPGREAPMLRR
jgi:hypothetical protein